MAKRKNVKTSLAFDEKTYQQDDDARTLARAEEIRSDKSRMKGASIGAKRIIDDAEENLKGLKKVARKKIG